MKRYCKQCGRKLDDGELFCTACGAKYEENDTELRENRKIDSGFLKTKWKKLFIVIGVIVLLLIAGIASGFFSDFKEGYDTETNKEISGNNEEVKDETKLQRISKDYQYKLISQDIPSLADWFVESGEIYGIADETLYHLNQGETTLEEIGDIGIGKCIPASGENDWFVFTDSENVYKYNIQNKSVDVVMDAEYFGSAVEVNNVLYYYSEKEEAEWEENARNSESYVPSFSGSEYSIWALNLSNGEEEKLIENVQPGSRLVVDPLDDQYVYFTLFTSVDSDYDSLSRYNCKTKEVEIINDKGIDSTNLFVYNGTCYVFGEDVLLLSGDDETCLYENLGMSVNDVICSGEYLICNTDSMDEIVIFEGENVYNIEKTWGKEWTFGQGDVIFAQNGRLWLMEWTDDADQYIFSVDFDGNLSEEKDWIMLAGGEFVAYLDQNLWILGQPKEDWEYKGVVDDAVVNDLESPGYDVKSIGQYENGKTELTMNVGEYGLYQIPLDEQSQTSVLDEKGSSQNEDDKLNEQEKGIIAEKDSKTQAKQDSSDEIVEMYDNLQEYEGTWGDFGSHVDKYQGMVESAIKSSISLSDYFGGDVNEVYMYLYKVEDNDDMLIHGATATNQHYMIRFEGLNPNETGMYRTLECRVDSPDGVNLVYTEQSYY